ncbi:MAG: sigma-70 family RNA polymerase sigma factor [Pirellulales bacterium]|nr:sigma-70 family RNA polymerase sigma factor [Pirellulales bacterium]
MADDDFAELLASEQNRLRRVIRSVVLCSATTADILQRANLIAWKKRNDFEAGTKFRGWINAIVRYEILAHRRDRARKKEIMLSEETEELLFLANDNLEDDREGEAQALRECVETLREQDRALLRERYSSAGTLQAYAEKTGRSVAGLRVTLHRLRQALKKCVEARLSVNQKS